MAATTTSLETSKKRWTVRTLGIESLRLARSVSFYRGSKRTISMWSTRSWSKEFILGSRTSTDTSRRRMTSTTTKTKTEHSLTLLRMARATWLNRLIETPVDLPVIKGPCRDTQTYYLADKCQTSNWWDFWKRTHLPISKISFYRSHQHQQRPWEGLSKKPRQRMPGQVSRESTIDGNMSQLTRCSLSLRRLLLHRGRSRYRANTWDHLSLKSNLII